MKTKNRATARFAEKREGVGRRVAALLVALSLAGPDCMSEPDKTAEKADNAAPQRLRPVGCASWSNDGYEPAAIAPKVAIVFQASATAQAINCRIPNSTAYMNIRQRPFSRRYVQAKTR